VLSLGNQVGRTSKLISGGTSTIPKFRSHRNSRRAKRVQTHGNVKHAFSEGNQLAAGHNNLRRDTTVELVTQLNELIKCADGSKRTRLHRLIKNLITKATTADDVLDKDGNVIKEGTNEVRNDYQPQDSQGPRPQRFFATSATRRRRDRVTIFCAVHESAFGTTRLCPDVRDHGEFRRVSGPSVDVSVPALLTRHPPIPEPALVRRKTSRRARAS
jgi:hypothetical protein